MPVPAIETVAAAKIPEVRAFLKAQKAYAQWKEDFPAAARKLAAIAAEYGPCLEAADHVVRERRVSAPPFELKHFAGRLRPEKLCELVGRTDFVRLGGTILPKETFEIDRRVFDALVARKEIPEAMAEEALVYAPVYKRPPELSVP